MAEATTRPTRTRRAPAKTATPAKAATPKAAAPTEAEAERERYGFTMDEVGDTKSYAVFTPPRGSGCVGKLYVPLGTVEVKVLLIGPADVVKPE